MVVRRRPREREARGLLPRSSHTKIIRRVKPSTDYLNISHCSVVVVAAVAVPVVVSLALFFKDLNSKLAGHFVQILLDVVEVLRS